MTKIYLISAILSFIPISELRGGIPYAYLNGVPIIYAYLLCVLVNALVAPFFFFFLETIHKAMYRLSWYRKFFDKSVARARKKVGEKIQKYGMAGLMVFVAIPLPITGAWTGALGAWVMGLDKKKSSLFIALGVMISGIIVSLVILTGSSLSSIFTKQINI
ncbi:MAG: small multi-drug export protein [Sphaerochaetaceae bacterium]|nr:small multi-drug export protein [Sphaerochaetaceae bacterium]